MNESSVGGAGAEWAEAEEFAGELGRLYGPNLVSVLLYGSAARGEYRPGISDLNVLVLVTELAVPELRRAAPVARGWIERGNPPPLMLSEGEWRASADVFPIEYSEIRDAHRLLAGRSPFAGLSIDQEHLRLQLERELRSKKIQLREGYLAFGQQPEELGRLLAASLPTFLTLFRALLRLIGTPVPRRSVELVGEVGRRVGFEPSPVLELLRLRDGGAVISTDLDGPLPVGYLAAVEATVRWMDGFAGAAGGAGEG